MVVFPFILETVRYTRGCDLPENTLELICIEIKPLKYRPFLVVAWYRPPNDPVASFDKLEQILNFLGREEKEIILIGDTNCDLSQHNKEQPLDNNNTKHICNIYELFSFKVLMNRKLILKDLRYKYALVRFPWLFFVFYGSIWRKRYNFNTPSAQKFPTKRKWPGSRAYDVNALTQKKAVQGTWLVNNFQVQ